MTLFLLLMMRTEKRKNIYICFGPRTPAKLTMELFELFQSANYLHIKVCLMFTCNNVAGMFKGRRPHKRFAGYSVSNMLHKRKKPGCAKRTSGVKRNEMYLTL